MIMISEYRRPCFPICNTSSIMLDQNKRKSRNSFDAISERRRHALRPGCITIHDRTRA
jgi:hypothetical protein